jgi:hypothetical protein
MHFPKLYDTKVNKNLKSGKLAAEHFTQKDMTEPFEKFLGLAHS